MREEVRNRVDRNRYTHGSGEIYDVLQDVMTIADDDGIHLSDILGNKEPLYYLAVTDTFYATISHVSFRIGKLMTAECDDLLKEKCTKHGID